MTSATSQGYRPSLHRGPDPAGKIENQLENPGCMGFVRTRPGDTDGIREVWMPAWTQELFLSRPLEELSFQENVDDLILELEQANPAPDELLTRVIPIRGYRYGVDRDAASRGIDPRRIVLAEDKIYVLAPEFAGLEPDESWTDEMLCEETRRLGQLRIRNANSRLVSDLQHSPESLLQQGIYVEARSDKPGMGPLWAYCLIYNPKEAKRRLRLRQRKGAAPVLRVWDLHRFNFKLQNEHLGDKCPLPPSTGMWGAAQVARRLINQMVAWYGPGSYRRTQHFREFITDWPARSKATKRRFDSSGLLAFWTWLDEEAQLPRQRSHNTLKMVIPKKHLLDLWKREQAIRRRSQK